MDRASLIFTRKHPTYELLSSIWERNKKAYEGGSIYLNVILSKHSSELQEEFTERQENSYYLNLPRKITNKMTDLVLSTPPIREGVRNEICNDFNKKGYNTNEVMTQLKAMFLLYGKSWLFVNNTEYGKSEVDLATKSRLGLRPYTTAISPLNITDWAYGSDGNLDWAIISENVIEKIDPFTEAVISEVKTLWTRDTWQKFSSALNSSAIIEHPAVKHEFGEVPLIELTDVVDTDATSRPIMEDIVRISDSINRGETELQTNIIKQAYGLLVVPESFLMTQTNLMTQLNRNNGDGEPNMYDKSKEQFAMMVGRSSCITESEGEKGIARYISPDGVTTESIAKSNDRLVKTLYELVGFMVTSATTQRESSDSKAWNAQDMTASLQKQAERLEQVEIKAWSLMNRIDSDIPVPSVAYNRDFSSKDFKSLIMGLVELTAIDGGELYQKRLKVSSLELMDKIVKIPDNEKVDILSEINSSDGLAVLDVEDINWSKNKSNGDKDESLKSKTDYDKSNDSISNTL